MFQSVKDDLDRVGKFDLAIIAAGSYAMPLAVYCKERHHSSAIVMGGGSQLLFGLKGKRWDTHNVLSKLYGKHWMYPLQVDTPNNSHTIEMGGPYWGSKTQTLMSCPVTSGEHDRDGQVKDFELAYQVHATFPLDTRTYDTLQSTATRISTSNGFVFLLFLNRAYLDMTKSFICNLRSLNATKTLSHVMFVTTDDTTSRDLSEFAPEVGGVFTKMYQQESTDVSYGTADYFRLTVERLKVQQQLLEMGVHVVVIEADATWFGDAERVETLLRSELPRYHIVSADDTGGGQIARIPGPVRGRGILASRTSALVFSAVLAEDEDPRLGYRRRCVRALALDGHGNRESS